MSPYNPLTLANAKVQHLGDDSDGPEEEQEESELPEARVREVRGEEDEDEETSSRQELPQRQQQEPDCNEGGPETGRSDPESLSYSRQPVLVVPSLFPHRPPSVYFPYHHSLKLPERQLERLTLEEYEERQREAVTPDVQRGDEKAVRKESRRPYKPLQLYYKAHWKRRCIRKAFDAAGFRVTQSERKWTVYYGKHLKEDAYRSLSSLHRVSTIPGSALLSKKDRLARLIQSKAKEFPGQFDFHPETYVLPGEKERFERDWSNDRKSVWIAKPSNNACGRGIRLIHPRGVSKLPTKSSWVVQRYISNPLLVRGKKFDIRLYVLVTSMDPLRLYLYQEGLVRWCTEDFSLEESALKDKYRHLTNFAINKTNPNFSAEKDSLDSGKCSFQVLLEHLKSEGRDTDLAVRNIRDLIVKTLIAGEGDILPSYKSVMRHPNTCFELFGFDVMLDENLKSWLIEVNIYPSLMSGADIDKKVKGALLADMLQLVGIPAVSSKDCEREFSERMQQRRQGANGATRREDEDGEELRSFDHAGRSRLAPVERHWIEDLIEEERRMKSGAFQRLFPQASSLPNYLPLFSRVRASDRLMQLWLDSPAVERNTEFLISHPPSRASSVPSQRMRERGDDDSSLGDLSDSPTGQASNNGNRITGRKVNQGQKAGSQKAKVLRTHNGHVRSLRRKVLLSRSLSDTLLSPSELPVE